MCGRFTITGDDAQAIAEGLGVPLEQLQWYRPRYNVAPTDEHFILRMEHERRFVERAKWGLVNWWARDARDAAKRINARAETIDRLAPFREPFEKRRCAVPTDGFFEWTGPKNDRRPLWYHRPDGGLLLLAGLWDEWQPRPHEYEKTFTIITTDANALIAPVHDRMPVVLLPDDVDAWIDPQNHDLEGLKKLLRPVPAEFLVARPVSPKLNSVKYDEREGLIEQPALPGLA